MSTRTPRSGSPPIPSKGPRAAGSAPILTDRQRKYLRGLAHSLQPVVRLGSAGLTAGVTGETERALHDHELIKVKAAGADRHSRDANFSDLAEQTASVLVQRIGNVAVLYRPRADMPRILIPAGDPPA